MGILSGLQRDIRSELQTKLHEVNPYVSHFKTAAALAAEGTELDLLSKADAGDVDVRRYNAPVADEVAALLPGQPSAANRDFVLQLRK